MQAGASGERSRRVKTMHMLVKHAAGVVVLASIATVCCIAGATAQNQLPFAYPKAGQDQ